MVFTVLLLLFLFLAGFLNFYFFSPSKKVQAKSVNINPSPTSPTMNATTSQVALQEVMSDACFEDKKSELHRVFDTFDKNGDGFITKQELKQSLKNIGMLVSDKEVEEMVSKVDSNGDELIDLEEFCLLCEAIESREGEGSSIKIQEGDEEVDLKEAFDVFDKDQDGKISFGELGSVLNSLGLKEGKKVEDCKEMIRKVDMDGDGMVNFDEFKQMMRNGGAVLFPENST